MLSSPKQIQVPKTLDVEAVERELAKLWLQTGHEDTNQAEAAVLRARVANLMIFSPTTSRLQDVSGMLVELSPAHPCRALVIAGDKGSPDQDIEIYISSFCRSGIEAETRNLCCEEVTLTAGGKFVEELPSAALPLLVPDLPVFLWWHDDFSMHDKVFEQLCRGADRLVIDSVSFLSDGLNSVGQLCADPGNKRLAISDINWERLTSWRALLASFYDVAQYRPALEALTRIEVNYVAPENSTDVIAPQAILIAGWLASRLGWQPIVGSREITNDGLRIDLTKQDRNISLELRKASRPDMRPGRLARVELKSESESAGLVVSRGESGLHIETYANVNGQIQPGQLLPVRNRSSAQLIGREMEILVNDKIYVEAIAMGMAMVT